MQRAAQAVLTTTSRHISTMTRSRVQTRTNLSTSPLSTLKTVNHTTPGVLTTSQRFAPTSKGWNKKTSVAHRNKIKTKRLDGRYHNTDYCSVFPQMTLAKFKLLPRPLFIESEVMDIFIPAPQLERNATKHAINVAQQAAQRPY